MDIMSHHHFTQKWFLKNWTRLNSNFFFSENWVFSEFYEFQEFTKFLAVACHRMSFYWQRCPRNPRILHQYEDWTFQSCKNGSEIWFYKVQSVSKRYKIAGLDFTKQKKLAVIKEQRLVSKTSRRYRLFISFWDAYGFSENIILTHTVWLIQYESYMLWLFRNLSVFFSISQNHNFTTLPFMSFLFF